VLVIVLTNYSSDQFREKALQEGADYFLDKAMEFEKAVAILKETEEVL
jgi:DNA-binding NarL/FixJ family response regulator